MIVRMMIPCMLWALTLDPAHGQVPTTHYDPTQIVGPGECARCHSVEELAWQKTHHFQTFRTLPSSAEAEDIADRMDIFDVTEESACLQCHFTVQQTSPTEDVTAISGISCELCHGAAKNWIEVHNDLGEWENDKTSEPAEHKAARLQAAAEKGMNQLNSVVSFVSNCYGCHTVPNEKLVNVGGHPAGSDFEIVSWSQGEVRHNFLESENKNRPSSSSHLQLLYITGKALNLEYGLRGIAAATEKGPYATAMQKRIEEAGQHLRTIADAHTGQEPLQLAELDTILESIPKTFPLGERDTYLTSAAKIREAILALEANHKSYSKELDKLTPLIPTADQWKGPVFRK